MLKKRIIPCLDVKNGKVVKGINFVKLVDAGEPSEQAKIYNENGADEIYSYVAHGVLSGKALEKIENSQIKELVLTDSIQVSEEVKKAKKIRHISIAPLMGEAIKRIHSDSSVSALFD